MDKVAANNHFVAMRKEVKKAKSMVAGNIIRKITKLRKELEKQQDESQADRLGKKIEKLLNDVKSLKEIDTYEISKKATLQPDSDYWNRVISDCKALNEDVLTAKVISKNNVRNRVLKFLSDNKDYSEWLDEYIEFREKKKKIISGDSRKPLRGAKKFRTKENRKNREKLSRSSRPEDDQ